MRKKNVYEVANIDLDNQSESLLPCPFNIDLFSFTLPSLPDTIQQT